MRRPAAAKLRTPRRQCCGFAVPLAQGGDDLHAPVGRVRVGVLAQYAARGAAVERQQVSGAHMVAHRLRGIRAEQAQPLLPLTCVERRALAGELHELMQQRHDMILELERAAIDVAPVEQARAQLVAAVRQPQHAVEALERGDQAQDRALVHAGLGRKIMQAAGSPVWLERCQDRQRPFDRRDAIVRSSASTPFCGVVRIRRRTLTRYAGVIKCGPQADALSLICVKAVDNPCFDRYYILSNRMIILLLTVSEGMAISSAVGAAGGGCEAHLRTSAIAAARDPGGGVRPHHSRSVLRYGTRRSGSRRSQDRAAGRRTHPSPQGFRLGLFCFFNRNKRSLIVDYKSSQGLRRRNRCWPTRTY